MGLLHRNNLAHLHDVWSLKESSAAIYCYD